MSIHDQTHVTHIHFCGHTHVYRHRAEWPEHRPCFTCAQAINHYLYSKIAPHIRTQAGRGAVLAIFHEHLETLYKLAYAKR